MSQLHEYWDGFYASGTSSAVPSEPSSFARWVQDRLIPGQTVAEFGFGNARDSLWFARKGHKLTGYDFAESAVHQAQARVRDGALDAEFSQLDLYDFDATTAVGHDIAADEGTVSIYGRFLIHSLEESGRNNLFDLAATGLVGEGELFLEFRTGLDENTEHVFGEDHYRVYLDPERVKTELETRGALVTHIEAGHGLAVFRDEDPHVARVVARWASD